MSTKTTFLYINNYYFMFSIKVFSLNENITQTVQIQTVSITEINYSCVEVNNKNNIHLNTSH